MQAKFIMGNQIYKTSYMIGQVKIFQSNRLNQILFANINLLKNNLSTLDTIPESQFLKFWPTTIALFFQNSMPFQVCALACIGVLTTIHRKRFYRNIILINLTLILAYLLFRLH